MIERLAQMLTRTPPRSFWVARYAGRDDVYEKDCDWKDVPRRGMSQLILSCPGGKSGVLAHPSGDISDRAFQFKIAYAMASGTAYTEAHVIGVLTGTGSACACFAWEYEPKRLVQFWDDLADFQYGAGAMANPSIPVLLGRPTL